MADSDDEDFAALLAESERASSGRERRLQAGEVVRGRVISVGATTAFVAVGGKAEAAIDVAEFRDQQTGAVTLKEGDEIEATVVDDGAQSGSIVLKRVAGRGGHLPGELEQAFANRIPVEGVVTGEVKGGYSVQIGACARSARDPRSTGDASRAGPTSASGWASASRSSRPEGATSWSRAASSSRKKRRCRPRRHGRRSARAP